MSFQLEQARSQVKILEKSLAMMPGNAQIQQMLNNERAQLQALEATFAQQQQLAQSQAFGGTAAMAPQQGPTLEQRVGNIEQHLQALMEAAKPALTQAAEAGAAVVAAIGQAMTPEQAQFVQERLDKSPEFFTTPDSQEAINIWISAWQDYEKRKSA